MAYDSFFNEFTSIFFFPTEENKVIKLNSRKPWVTNGLLKSIKRKNKLYRKYLSFPTAQNETLYKAYKNKLTKLLKNAKRFYYETKFECVKSDIKKAWRVLNKVLNRKKKQNTLTETFSIKNQDISDPLLIANHFCKYFSGIGPNLADKIPFPSQSHPSYLHAW
jgi:hypothetical protein